MKINFPRTSTNVPMPKVKPPKDDSFPTPLDYWQNSRVTPVTKKPVFCYCCGASIKRYQSKCEYCGTYYD
jgi:hypothetical protein